jgi:hypothetical protein
VGELRLTALLNRATWQATDQVPERAVAAGRLDRFGHVDPTNGGSTDRASLAFTGRWSDGAAITRAAAYLVHYRLNLFSNFTSSRTRSTATSSTSAIAGSWPART